MADDYAFPWTLAKPIDGELRIPMHPSGAPQYECRTRESAEHYIVRVKEMYQGWIDNGKPPWADPKDDPSDRLRDVSGFVAVPLIREIA